MLTRRLCAACEAGNLQDVKGLIEQRGITPNYPSADGDGRTPLHFAAEKLHVEVVEYLLQNAASVHSSDRLGFTPLSRVCLAVATESSPAVLKRAARVANALRKYGADFRTRDKFGNSIIHILATKAHRKPFIFWSDNIANADEGVLNGDTSIEDSRISLFLLPGWGLLTPLHMASESGNLEVLSYILEVMFSQRHHGLLVNAIDAIGWSPLHWAVLRNDVKSCQELIKNGAYIHQRDYLSREPIDIALTFHSMEAARYLSHVISSSVTLQVSPRSLHDISRKVVQADEGGLSESTPERSSSSSSSSSGPPSSSLKSASSGHDNKSFSLSLTSDADHESSSDDSSSSTLKSPAARHHFLLISASLALVICSAAELGLRNVSALHSSLGWHIITGFILGPAIVTTILLFLSRYTPTKILPCLKRWRHETSKLAAFHVDLVICLLGLVPVKCGPLIIAHSLLLEERHAERAADFAGKKLPLSASTSPDSPLTAVKEKETSDQSVTKDMELTCYRLINEHSAPEHFMGDKGLADMPSMKPPLGNDEVTEIRAELRPEWCALYKALNASVRKLFQNSNIALDVPLDYVLIALWIFQSFLTGSKTNDSSGGRPLSTTSETVADYTPQDIPSSSADGPSSWQSSEPSHQEWTETSEVGSGSDKLPVTDTLFPGMDSDTRRQLMTAARHASTTSEQELTFGEAGSNGNSSSSSSSSSAEPSEEISLLSSSSSNQKSSDVSPSASESGSSSSSSSSSGSRHTSSEYTDPLSEFAPHNNSPLRSCRTSPYKMDPLEALQCAQNHSNTSKKAFGDIVRETLLFPQQRLSANGDEGGVGKVMIVRSPQRYISAEEMTVFNIDSVVYEVQPHPPSCTRIPIGTLVGNPLLNAFALRGLSRQFFTQSFVVWLREFQKMASFLRERPRLCIPVKELSTEPPVITQSVLTNIFKQRAADAFGSSRFPLNGGSDEEKLSGLTLLDRVMSLMKKESSHCVDRQCIPPFIDLDVLARETRHQTVVATPQHLHLDETSSSISIDIETEGNSPRSHGDKSAYSPEKHATLDDNELAYDFSTGHVAKSLRISYGILVLVPCIMDMFFAVTYLILYQPKPYIFTLSILLGTELLFLLAFTVGCLFRC